jgi:DNA-binding CsgD family transcriptional regulator
MIRKDTLSNYIPHPRDYPVHPLIKEAVSTLGLTRQESRITERLAQGYETRDLLEYFEISPNTLSRHLHNINNRLGTGRRYQLNSMVLGKLLDLIGEDEGC